MFLLNKVAAHSFSVMPAHADDPTPLPCRNDLGIGKWTNAFLAFLSYPSSQLKVCLHGPVEAHAENLVVIRLPR